jgi:hypothetical protein
MVDYVDHGPDNLDRILAEIEATRTLTAAHQT